MVTLREVTGDPEELAALLPIDRDRQGQGIGAAAVQVVLVLMDKLVTVRRGGGQGPTGGRRGGAR